MSNPAIESCPNNQEAESDKKENCRFGSIEMYKEGSEHKERLAIAEAMPIKFKHKYEIIAGTSDNPANLIFNIDGINVSNCEEHTDNIFTFLSDGEPITNQDSYNSLRIFFQKRKDIFLREQAGFKAMVNSCSQNTREIEIIAYPDIEYTLEVRPNLSITNDRFVEKSMQASTIGISFKFEGVWDKSKKGFVEGSLIKGMTGSKNLTWRTKVGGKWGDKEGNIYLKKYKYLYDLFKKIFAGKLRLDGLLQSGLFENNPTKKLGFKFSQDCFFRYKRSFKEDQNSFLVGDSTVYEFGGKILGFEWSYDITSTLFLLFGWVGKLLDYARIAMEKARLASLSASIRLTGSFNINNINFESVKYPDNRVVSKDQGSGAELIPDIGLSLIITGRMRVDSTTYGIDVKTNSGIKCILSNKDSTIEIKFTGLKIGATLFYESYSAYTRNEAPPESLVSGEAYSIKVRKNIVKEMYVTVMNECTICPKTKFN